MKKIVLLYPACFFFIFLLYQPGAFCQNVGIGTSTPAFKLDVGGRMRIKTGTLGNVSTSSGFWLEDYRDGTNRMFIGMQDSIRGGFYGAGGGVGWGFNFNNNTGDISLINGALGVGTITPLYDIHISKSQPAIGFNDIAKNHFSGMIQGDSANLLINAYRKNSLGANSAGDLILQINTGGIPGFLAGNVGIGTSVPDEKLHISGNLKLQGSTTQIILSNNSADKGRIYFSGNDIKFGTAVANSTGRVVITTNNTDQIAVTSTGELNRPTRTGTADMLPIAYGRITHAGTILSSAGIQSVTKIDEGYFQITLSGEDVSANPNLYTIIVTPFITGADEFTYPSVRVGILGDQIEIELARFQVNYINHPNCSCPQSESNSLLTGQTYVRVKAGFSVLIYKQ